MRYRFAKNVVLLEKDGGGFLLARKPLCLLHLNSALTSLLRAVRDDTPRQDSGNEENILNKISKMGFLQCCWDEPMDLSQAPSVSVVIPVKDRAEELRRCLASLAALRYPREKIEIIVVDDGSSDTCREIAEDWGAIMLSSGGTGLGPSAARNIGAAAATGEILAFIDSDCTASAKWLNELIAVFGDLRVAAVGGKVEGLHTASALDRYEATMSSLSLGARQRSAREGQDTFYLPSCNLLVRRKVFLTLHGFDRTMHVGEDVDLSYRLRDKGWHLVYLPQGTVHHEHRNRYASFMARRFDYGTSEEILQRRHPLRKKRLPLPPWLLAVVALCLTMPLTGYWGVLSAFTLLAVDGLVTGRKTRQLGIRLGLPTLLAGRCRALGSLVYYLCFHLVRYYILVLLLACCLMPSLMPLGTAVFLCAALVDYAVKKPKLAFVLFASIYLFEQLSYGLGVLRGCLARRNFASYRVIMGRQRETC